FEFYLSMSALQQHYPNWIELQPLAFTPVLTHYIERFYQRKQAYGLQQTGTPPEKVVAFLRMRPELQDLIQRPLLLLMLLDIFAAPKEMDDAQWNKTKLYQRYTEKWLKNEAAKPGSHLKWHEKALVLQEVAWATYTGKSFGASLD